MCCKLHAIVLAAVLATAASSGIPMWEFLTRGEKMSHLFSMFVKQVADRCDTSTMPDCQKVLMVYGLTNLAKMEEDSLDKMDPYQRNANDIIWNSMMGGSYKKQDSHEHRDYYADSMEPTTSGNHLGSQEEASSSIEKYAEAPSHYVIGPMVVRVYPDGRPVPDDARRPLPVDEDAEEFAAMRSKPLPSVEHIMDHHQNKKSLQQRTPRV